MAALATDARDGFDLIIANYLLDNLPARVLRLSNGLLEELEVRTTLRADLDPSRLHGRTAREWVERVRATNGDDPQLVDLYPWFSLDCRHRPVDRSSFPFGSLIPEPSATAPKYWSHHEKAWTWLKEALPLVRPGGGLLLNDYGHFPHQNPGRVIATEHFSGSLANSINFDELEAFPRLEPAWEVAAPETDARNLHSRWIGRRADKTASGIFLSVFDGERRNRVPDLLNQARARADEERIEEARWLFWQAHSHAPRCWYVLEHWSAFCLTRLRDFATAHDLAEKGLRLHPSHPPLWNLKGDALYEQKRYSEAEACYKQTLEINPREIRGRLNLAYVYLETGRYSEALAVLAQALALDIQGHYRGESLRKQRDVLQRMSLEFREATGQQLNRFRNMDAPG